MKKMMVFAAASFILISSLFLSCPSPTGGGGSSGGGGAGGSASFQISSGGTDLASGGSRDLGLVLSNGSASQPTVFTITNTGTSALTIDSNTLTVTGGDASMFILTRPSLTSLAAGASADFSIVFKPTASLERIATVQGSYSPPEGGTPFSYTLSGYGTTNPIWVFRSGSRIASGSTVDCGTSNYPTVFAKVMIELPPSDQTYEFIVQNIGSSPVTMQDPPGNTNSTNFSVMPLSPSNTIPANSAATTFILNYTRPTPPAPGLQTTVVTLNNSDSTIASQFTAQVKAVGPIMEIKDWNDVGITKSEPITYIAWASGGQIIYNFTVTNLGNADLKVSSVEMQTPNEPEFVLNLPSENLPYLIPPNGTKLFSVTMEHKGINKLNQVTIISDTAIASNQSFVINLSVAQDPL
jgi:hypothetical protein